MTACFKVLSCPLPTDIEENHKNPQSGQPTCWPREAQDIADRTRTRKDLNGTSDKFRPNVCWKQKEDGNSADVVGTIGGNQACRKTHEILSKSNTYSILVFVFFLDNILNSFANSHYLSAKMNSNTLWQCSATNSHANSAKQHEMAVQNTAHFSKSWKLIRRISKQNS